MSKTAQVLLVITAVCWTAAATNATAAVPSPVGALWPLWVFGTVALVIAIALDLRAIRGALEQVPVLRSGPETMSRLITRGTDLRACVYGSGDEYDSFMLADELVKDLKKWASDVDNAVRKHHSSRYVLFVENRNEVEDWNAPQAGFFWRKFVDDRLQRLKLILGSGDQWLR
jgi:hypothetical protein